MTTKILVVDDNEMNLRMVSAILKRAGYQVFTASNGKETLENIANIAPDLAILDVMMPDMDGYELCRRLRHRSDTADLPIIMLTALSELDERLKAFEVGADDFMAKPFDPPELLARIKVLLRRAAQTAPSARSANGEMTVFFSLRGGVGVSTLATNIAIGLAQIWGEPLALVDLSLINGISALMLDLPLRNSWGDIANIKSEEIDEEVVEKVLLKHESGLRVLAAPGHPEEAELLNAEQVSHVLDILRGKFPYILVDLPHNFDEITLAALDKADRIALILSPELAAVRAASTALNVFRQLGYPEEKIELLMNWTFRSKGLPRAEIEKTLKHKISLVLPYAGEALVVALTLGKPPAFANPEGAIGALFEDIAYFWSKEEQKSNPPQPYPEGYVRVRKRARAKQKRK
jgi:pilus assembly protein CpaE